VAAPAVPAARVRRGRAALLSAGFIPTQHVERHEAPRPGLRAPARSTNLPRRPAAPLLLPGATLPQGPDCTGCPSLKPRASHFSGTVRAAREDVRAHEDHQPCGIDPRLERRRPLLLALRKVVLALPRRARSARGKPASRATPAPRRRRTRAAGGSSVIFPLSVFPLSIHNTQFVFRLMS